MARAFTSLSLNFVQILPDVTFTISHTTLWGITKTTMGHYWENLLTSPWNSVGQHQKCTGASLYKYLLALIWNTIGHYQGYQGGGGITRNNIGHHQEHCLTSLQSTMGHQYRTIWDITRHTVEHHQKQYMTSEEHYGTPLERLWDTTSDTIGHH